MKQNSVLIFGLGLIGGSICLKAKEKNLFDKIFAFGRNLENLKLAKEQKIIDGYYTNIDEINFSEIDIIFLCTPIEMIIKIAEEIIPKINKKILITDVGSTKSYITEKINEIIKSNKSKAEFIGAHPIAGKEKTGFKYSSASLFENTYCIITPESDNSIENIEKIKKLWQELGSIVILMTPEKHDFITAIISHLPHIISAGLVNTANEEQKKEKELLNYAAGGFKDITRISSSDEELWTQICLSNKKEIIKILDNFLKIINNFKINLINENKEKIKDYFLTAKNIRNSIRLKGVGLLQNFYDLLVDVVDKPGIIANITKLLSDNYINIKDIEILKYREEENGVLKLSFANEDDLNNAFEILNANNYLVKKR
ncbi:MAG TPA: prephenate dehydrogenase/arogenate dehydrogenase family protein [bacterium]|nr:prephenate dehydrogenase/arogenate dehydrogenase family protein [bacterium]HOL47737.1 prephenate dehydrogenase/arogenate dehydrogenase family protein [bacterium]HPQ18029.1 prephenate dehydrogenase/arogenate dehydrogenase family protein [bacterium]